MASSQVRLEAWLHVKNSALAAFAVRSSIQMLYRFTRILNDSAWAIRLSSPSTWTRFYMRHAQDEYWCAVRAIGVPLVARAGMASGRTCPRLCVQHEMAFMAENSFRPWSTLVKNRPFYVLMIEVRQLIRN